MCGIAGFFGRRKIEQNIINKTLILMKNRGPDFSNFYKDSLGDNISVNLLHTRLSIIDLNDRSNQPFVQDGNILIFNGEIYNYLELKKNLIKFGEKFKTNSDTEVLIKSYKVYGEECVNYLEGMWAFAIYDSNKKKLFMSRDRFGEKPLYYYQDKNGIYFASEIKFIRGLVNKPLEINYNQLNDFLSLGYKTIFKSTKTFFKDVNSLKNSENFAVNTDLKIRKSCYWVPSTNFVNQKISLKDCIYESKNLLFKSIKIRSRSDVPIALNLSGGVDSSGLASVLTKKFNIKIKTFSIIDEDVRYNESKNIDLILRDLKCENVKIFLKKENFFNQLSDLIKYHNAPVATISNYAHSLLAKEISKNGYKVSISGTAADEIYSGYYDHFLLHLKTCKDNKKNFKENFVNWKTYISEFIRNKNLMKYDLYIKNPNFRSHIYDGRNDFKKYLSNPSLLKFKEINYSKELFKNRRFNELFNEITPLTLNQEDLNCMKYSVENRSPYLDTNLVNFMFSVPNNFLIKNGYAKYILRESLKDFLNEEVRLDRIKKGFNGSINSLVNFHDKKTLEFLLDPKSQIYELINRKEIIRLFKYKETPNHLSKFLFSFISCKLFLDNNLKSI